MKVKKLIPLGLVLAMMISAAGCASNKKADAAAPTGTADASGEIARESSGNLSGDLVILDLVIGSTRTFWYSYGATFSEIIPKGPPAGSMVSAVVEDGTTSNPIQVAANAYQVGIGYNLSNRWAYNGENLYTEAYDSLRDIASCLDTFYYITLVRTNAGWTDLVEVAANHTSVKISVLPAGNMGNIVTPMILEYYGITFSDIIFWGGTVEYAGWSTSMKNIRDGHTDLVYHNITQNHAAVTGLSSTVDMTFIQFPQEMIDTSTGGEGFSPETLPASYFKGQDAAIDTFGITSSLFCTADMSDDVAYDIAKALCENVNDMKAGHTTLQRLTAEKAGNLAGMGLPLHPGAEKYYKEAGILD